jgi:hypothetical protein
LLNELRTVDDDDDLEEGDTGLDPLHIQQGPALIVGTFPPASVTDLMEWLPPQETTDRLIARFFRGKEPAWSECR